MKMILTLLMCSSVGNTCLPPYQIEESYKDTFDCMTSGYQKSIDKLSEIGREEVNTHGIYIRFDCREYDEPKVST